MQAVGRQSDPNSVPHAQGDALLNRYGYPCPNSIHAQGNPCIPEIINRYERLGPGKGDPTPSSGYESPDMNESDEPTHSYRAISSALPKLPCREASWKVRKEGPCEGGVITRKDGVEGNTLREDPEEGRHLKRRGLSRGR